MRRVFGLVFALLLMAGATSTTADAQSASDKEVRAAIIQQSIAAYPGRCPCPYNRASNGSRCGGRSAYSRPGGHSPLCYEEDVSDEMVRVYRQRHGLKSKN